MTCEGPFRARLAVAASVAATLALALAPAAHAQTPSVGVPTSTGSDFWTTVPPTIDQGTAGRKLLLRLTAATATTATVSLADGSFDASYPVRPGAPASVALPSGAALPATSGVVRGRAVHVTAGAPVELAVTLLIPAGSTAFTALPTAALGRDHYVVGYQAPGLDNAAGQSRWSGPATTRR